MIPLYNPDGPQTVLGLPCAQNVLALPTWEYAFGLHPPKRILEIGSGTGAFTYALKQVAGPDVGVWSWDVTKAPTQGLEKRFKEHPFFYNEDALGETALALIHTILDQPGTCYVLCDGPNKLKEFQTFAPMLKPGDIIGAHDFMLDEKYWGWTEIRLHQTEPLAREIGLEIWMLEVFGCAGWLVYKKL